MTSNSNRNNNHDNNNNNHEREIHTGQTKHTTSNMKAINNINTNNNEDNGGSISDSCYNSNEEVYIYIHTY